MLCQEMNDFHFLSQESCMTGAFACFQSGLRTCFAITYMSEIKKGEISRVTFTNEQLHRYFPTSYTPEKMKREILAILKLWAEEYWEQ